METFWFLVVIVLFAVGIVGTVLPIFPGTTIIFAAAVLHRIMLGADHSLGWFALGVLLLLTLFTYAIDAVAGYMGAKKFGATRWGTVGGIIGAVVGLFFGLIGLFVGPVIGAIIGEIIGGQRLVHAGRAGWGTFLGAIAGMLAKLIIALAMIMIFLHSVSAPF